MGGREIPDKDAFVIADYYHGNFIRPYINKVDIIPYITHWAPIVPLPEGGVNEKAGVSPLERK